VGGCGQRCPNKLLNVQTQVNNLLLTRVCALVKSNLLGFGHRAFFSFLLVYVQTQVTFDKRTQKCVKTSSIFLHVDPWCKQRMKSWKRTSTQESWVVWIALGTQQATPSAAFCVKWRRHQVSDLLVSRSKAFDGIPSSTFFCWMKALEGLASTQHMNWSSPLKKNIVMGPQFMSYI